jgi:hypothetical protein
MARRVLDGDSPPQRQLATLLHDGAVEAQRQAEPVEDQIYYLQKEVVDRSLYVDTSHPLAFVFNPSAHEPFQQPPLEQSMEINQGLYALKANDPSNAPYIDNENRLFEILLQLQTMQHTDAKESLESRVYRELDRMRKQKELEWSRQRSGVHAANVVNTGQSNQHR